MVAGIVFYNTISSLLFSSQNICCRYSLELPCSGTEKNIMITQGNIIYFFKSKMLIFYFFFFTKTTRFDMSLNPNTINEYLQHSFLWRIKKIQDTPLIQNLLWICFFPYFFMKKYLLCTHHTCLTEGILIGTHNVCNHKNKKRKYFCWRNSYLSKYLYL